MQKTMLVSGIMLISMLIISCNTVDKAEQTKASAQMVTEVMNPESQSKITPDEILNEFKAGNKRFLSNSLTARDFNAQIKKTASGQYPKAAILSCVDSRVPVEYIFDQGIGDIFVARVAGNFMDEDMLGSAEFACKVAGSKVLMIMGHESCGAVKAAIDDVKLGNITAMLDKVEPAVERSQDFSGEKSTKNPEFVNYVSKNNVINTIETIRKNSPILKEMEEKGEIKIVGAMYSLSTGEVTFLEN
jgi:carbonic anhydrase